MTSDHFAIPSSGITSGGGQISSTGGLTIQSEVGQGMPIGLTGGDGDDYIVGSGFFYTTPGALDDQDEDTILSLFDNCPSIINIDQRDTNNNGIGDACDSGSDSDEDGLSNAEEYVLGTDPDNADTDDDGIGDLNDNCVFVQNPDQLDADGNGVGNACDAESDTDNDGFSDAQEFDCGSNPLDGNSMCRRPMPWLMLLLEGD